MRGFLFLATLCLLSSVSSGAVAGIDFGSEFIKVALVKPKSFNIVVDEQVILSLFILKLTKQVATHTLYTNEVQPANLDNLQHIHYTHVHYHSLTEQAESACPRRLRQDAAPVRQQCEQLGGPPC
jgi:formate hydrogenlyase subunit 4